MQIIIIMIIIEIKRVYRMNGRDIKWEDENMIEKLQF